MKNNRSNKQKWTELNHEADEYWIWLTTNNLTAQPISIFKKFWRKSPWRGGKGGAVMESMVLRERQNDGEGGYWHGAAMALWARSVKLGWRHYKKKYILWQLYIAGKYRIFRILLSAIVICCHERYIKYNLFIY